MGVAETLPCLVVGAEPTGLALAAQLRWFGCALLPHHRSLVRPRARIACARHTSQHTRILDSLGVADVLVAHGNPSARLVIHLGGQRVPSVRQLHARARLRSY